ncbi:MULTISPECIES: endonuclease/exonuclease/phosphatase family protein [unclassified Streptomyces]|uniref:endonuclease/exonuclease/phosphatase family protein n=1 Tax=unclassified Streptomyces TaxID=2593676 RepID=UPI0036E0CD14
MHPTHALAGGELPTIRVATYNMLDGGVDTSSTKRWKQQMEMLNEVAPDVLCLQEAKHFDAGLGQMAKATADALGMYWEIAPSASHGCHVMTLVRPGRVQFRDFEADVAEGTFHHTASRAALVALDTGWEFEVIATHLAPFWPAKRSEEASWLTEHGKKDNVLLVGDLNSRAPGDPEPADWDWLPAHLHSRHRVLNQDGSYGPSDRRALAALFHAGFRDPVTHAQFPWAQTVGYWSEEERDVYRSDYVLASEGMAHRLVSWAVVDTAVTRQISDHLPCYADIASGV